MTGTAMTEASEFDKIYKLGVVPIPTNMPMVRADNADLVYRTEEAKYDAVVEDIRERNDKGQPILVGTVSVEKSEHLSKKLTKLGVPHSVLNAKQHADEAKVVAMAGHKGAVTVATNMAGRGTDIMLGGSVEFLADMELRNRGLDPVETPDEYEAAWPATLETVKEQVAAEHDEVRDLGGLYVVGTERHESRRIDNQLRGRSGRQGDPGESRFYLSLAGRADAAVQVRLGGPGPPGPQDPRRRADREQAGHQRHRQRAGPGRVAELRVPQERPQVRRRHGPPAQGDLRRAARGARGRRHRGPGPRLHRRRRHRRRHRRDQEFAEEWDLEQLWTDLKQIWPVSLDHKVLEEEAGGRREHRTASELIEDLQTDAQAAYDAREAEVGEEVMRELERRVLLSVLDRKWREHLYEMDYLREGIYLRAYSQRDPLVEYQREGFDMFAAMMDGIKEESVGFLFNLEVSVEDDDEPRTRSRSRSRCAGSSGTPRPRTRWTPTTRSSRRVLRSRPTRSWSRPRGVRAQPAHPGQGTRRGQPAAEPLLLRTVRGRRGRGQGRRPSPRPTTRSPRSAATRSARAARARSTRCATAGRAARPV